MNKQEIKSLSDVLSPELAKKIHELDIEFDKHFMNKLNFKKSEYKAVKTLISKMLIDEIIPAVSRKVFASFNRNVVRGVAKSVKLKK